MTSNSNKWQVSTEKLWFFAQTIQIYIQRAKIQEEFREEEKYNVPVLKQVKEARSTYFGQYAPFLRQ